jgi:hypothetical protein
MIERGFLFLFRMMSCGSAFYEFIFYYDAVLREKPQLHFVFAMDPLQSDIKKY